MPHRDEERKVDRKDRARSTNVLKLELCQERSERDIPPADATRSRDELVSLSPAQTADSQQRKSLLLLQAANCEVGFFLNKTVDCWDRFWYQESGVAVTKTCKMQPQLWDQTWQEPKGFKEAAGGDLNVRKVLSEARRTCMREAKI